MKCQFCGRTDARIRESEIPTARITGRAHIDCFGHSQYRNLSVEEWREIKPLVTTSPAKTNDQHPTEPA